MPKKLDRSFTRKLPRVPRPKIYYKYYPCKDYVFETIEANQVYLASYRSLNDPFDPFVSAVFQTFTPTPGATAEMAQELLKKLQTTSVFCVSGTPDSELLWAHYAGAHSGFCIGYTDPLSLFMKVRYDDDIWRLQDAASRHLYEYAPFWLFLVKTTPWAYEREWRFVMAGEKSSGRRASPFKIAEVIFGHRLSDLDRERLLRAVAPHNPRFRCVVPQIRGGFCRFELWDVAFQFCGDDQPK